MNIVLIMGIILISGLLLGEIASKCHFPRITGYLLAGVILNPSVSHLVPPESVGSLNSFVPIILGIISYHVGSGLHLQSVRSLGKTIVSISFFQSLAPFLLTLVLVSFSGYFFANQDITIFNTYLPMGLVLGAIATSSAPAAIVAIIQECRAYGPVTTTTLATLAITDAVAVVSFSIATGIALPLTKGITEFSLKMMLLPPFIHVGKSILIGAICGFTVALAAKLIQNKPGRLTIILTSIFVCTGVSDCMHASSILGNMVLGFIAINLVHKDGMLHILDDVEAFLFPLFFVINGINFDLFVLKEIGILTLLVIIGRGCGKYCGTWFGAHIAKAPPSVTSYTGFLLLPKAGLTLGFAFYTKDLFPSFGQMLFNALVASTIINMLVTPLLAQYGLRKSGEHSKMFT